MFIKSLISLAVIVTFVVVFFAKTRFIFLPVDAVNFWRQSLLFVQRMQILEELLPQSSPQYLVSIIILEVLQADYLEKQGVLKIFLFKGFYPNNCTYPID